MRILESLAGTVRIKLTSADLSRCLQRINRTGVQVSDVVIEDDLCAQFQIHRNDFNIVKEVMEKSGDSWEIVSRDGLYWKMKTLIRRKTLLLGLFMLTFLVIYIPTRIFFIQVEGNESIPTRIILEAAAESGIGFGSSRREVRSEKMKNTLLEKIPDLQWAGVNTYGCTAIITVRERVKEENRKDDHISSIVAARDGIIKSCTVTQGNGLCKVGQAVQEGQVLISCYTDLGLTIQLTCAEGEIVGETKRDLTVFTPAVLAKRTGFDRQTEKYSLRIGKNRINFYKGSGICEASCVKMYSEYVLTLPGDFLLPIALIKETTVSSSLQKSTIEESDTSAMLQEFATRYLSDQMIAGQIEHRSERFSSEEEIISMTGEYACTEMIGRRRQEQIGENHGKTD